MIKDPTYEQTNLFRNDPTHYTYNSIRGKVTHRVTIDQDDFFFELTKISGSPVSVTTNNPGATREQLFQIIDQLKLVAETIGE